MLPQQTKPMSKSDSVKRYLYNKLINKKKTCYENSNLCLPSAFTF